MVTKRKLDIISIIVLASLILSGCFGSTWHYEENVLDSGTVIEKERCAYPDSDTYIITLDNGQKYRSTMINPPEKVEKRWEEANGKPETVESVKIGEPVRIVHIKAYRRLGVIDGLIDCVNVFRGKGQKHSVGTSFLESDTVFILKNRS